MTQDDRRCAATHVVVVVERTAITWGNAEHREETRRDARATHHGTAVGVAHREVGFVVAFDGGEERLLAAPIEKVGVGCARPSGDVAAFRFPDVHEPVRLDVWEWPKQDRIHDAEYRRVGADAQREREDGNAGEGRTAPQRPDRKLDVGDQRVHQGQPALCAHRLGGNREPTRRKQCLTARFGRGHPLAHVFRGCELEVVRQLLAQLGGGGGSAAAAEHSRDPQRGSAQPAHASLRCRMPLSYGFPIETIVSPIGKQ